MRKLISVMFLAGAMMFSCNTEHKQLRITATQEMIIDSLAGSCPNLTSDNKSNVVLSWIKQLDTATSVFCFAVSQDEGKTFGKPIEIPGSTNVRPHGENLPKVIFKPSGEIIAAWGAANPNPKNAYSGLVFYSQSFDSGTT